ncbi:MAG: ABC transporter permease [Geminicoccaceae bacterium]
MAASIAIPAGTAPRSFVSRLRATAPVAFWVGAAILALHLIAAGIGWVWTPYGWQDIKAGPPVAPASWAHPFGVDQSGRDVFSRVLYGGHIVILLAISGTALGVAIGGALGLLSGYLRGWFDEVLMRLTDAIISIPFLILALLIVAIAGPSGAGDLRLLVLVVALVYAPRVARVARAAGMDVATRDYVTVARLRGESAFSIVGREILPNCSGPLLVEFALRAGYAPILIGSLGFLGFGVRAPLPEWGRMMSENRDLIWTTPSALLGPGLTLASLVIGLNLFTEGLARVLGRTGRRTP